MTLGFVHTECLKVHSHVTSAFAYFFDLCRSVLQNANVKLDHYHFLPWNPFLRFGAKAKIDVTCDQDLRSIHMV